MSRVIRHVTSSLTVGIAVVAAVAVPGCASRRVVLERIPPPCELSLEGDQLLCDGNPYARLVGRFCGGPRKDPRHFVAPGDTCRGVGVLYADGSRVTLFSAKSLDTWAEPIRYNPGSKSEAIADWAYDVTVDVKGRRVVFVKEGTFRTSRWAYDIGSGALFELE
jgi:hypothetical protein